MPSSGGTGRNTKSDSRSSYTAGHCSAFDAAYTSRRTRRNKAVAVSPGTAIASTNFAVNKPFVAPGANPSEATSPAPAAYAINVPRASIGARPTPADRTDR